MKLFKKYAKPIDHKLLHRKIYRYISIPFIEICIKLKIKPNSITFAGTILRLVSFYYYLTFSWFTAVFLYQLGYLLDWVDGPVAKTTKTVSEFGKKIDPLLDLIIGNLLHIIIAMGLSYYYNNFILLVVPLIFFVLKTTRQMISLSINPGDRDKNFYNMQKADPYDKFYSVRDKIKSKYGFLSRLFTAIIDFNYVFLPFVVLFNFTLVLIFYFLNILTEIARLVFDIRSTFVSVKN